jgi:hypothetical protein
MEEWLREGNEKTDNVNYVINKYIQRFDEFLGSYRGGWGFKNSIRRPIDREMENV